jgi:hypothetical protein
MKNLDCFASRLPHRPYCADDLTYGLRIRAREIALKCKFIQPNPPNQTAWLVFDLDFEQASHAWEDSNLPCPTIQVINPENAHCHSLYGLKSPVFTDGYHFKPLAFAAAIQAAYRERLGGDPGYSGLICKNPLHGSWNVLAYPALYDLDDLAQWVDLTSPQKRPQSPKNGVAYGLGRNCTLFEELRGMAYRWIGDYKGVASFEAWRGFLEGQAQSLNLSANPTNPLHFSEVRAVAKSVAKWTWQKFDLGASNDRFSARQAHRATLSAASRNAKNADLRASARLMASSGMKQQAIALELGVNQATVSRWISQK